jgi:hypothetical protein
VFKNRMLRRKFGTQRGEVTKRWRKLHNEEFHYLNSSPNNIKIINEGGCYWQGM